MAELLVKAQENQWMKNLAVSAWSNKGLTQEKYDARGEKGDIVQVLPDGNKYWFNDPPQHILLRVSGLDYAKAKNVFERGIFKTEIINGVSHDKLVKKRKYYVNQKIVDDAIANKGELELTIEQFESGLKKRSYSDGIITSKEYSVKDLHG